VELSAQGSAGTSKNAEKSHSEAAAAETGSRNMAESTPMSSQIPTSYSTLYTLGVYLDSFWPFVGERSSSILTVPTYAPVSARRQIVLATDWQANVACQLLTEAALDSLWSMVD